MLYQPYELVLVTEPWHDIQLRYTGQIISRETPYGTIMVRRVPSDPSTMEEMKLDHLNKTPQTKKWIQYAEVSGNLYFPVDMLRYDYCTPVNFKIEEDEIGRIKTILNNGETKLIVGRATDLKSRQWTNGRWNSFGWSISPLKTLKFEKGK